MYGLSNLKTKIMVSKDRVECPVINCNCIVSKQTDVFRPLEQFFCEEHKIYISPSTFEYKNWQENILWKSKEDLDLLHSIFKVKREGRFQRDNSEDALTWNVFRFLEKNGLLTDYVQQVYNVDILNPRLIYWSYSQEEKTTFSLLSNARENFEKNPKKGSEPDIIILADNYLLIIEAKLNALNNTIGKESSSHKYINGVDKWWDEVFKSDFNTIAIEQKKYELVRFWLLGTWMAKELKVDFQLINLVPSKKELKIENIFCSHIKETDQRTFKRTTWEDIYKFIKYSNLINEEKQTMLNYFENKTIGYGSNFNIIKAFHI